MILAESNNDNSLEQCGSIVAPRRPSLRAGRVEAGRKKAEACVACHGPNGNSPNAAYPILAGQTSRYIYLQLKHRPADVAVGATALARRHARCCGVLRRAEAARDQVQTDPDKAAQGKARADAALCTMCDLGRFKGQNEIPRVAGQHYEYVVKQLKDSKAGRRTNDAGNMTSVSTTLSEQDMDNLANCLGSLY